jgi:hypothetical protein
MVAYGPVELNASRGVDKLAAPAQSVDSNPFKKLNKWQMNDTNFASNMNHPVGSAPDFATFFCAFMVDKSLGMFNRIWD